MSSSTHQIKVKAVDNTASGFKSIQKTAFNASSSIKKMIGGAVAAAGAYMGTKAIVSTVQELGSLSDIAQRTKTSVEELTQATTAFNILGIQHMGIEQFSKALDRMQKNTGRQGLTGFYETLTQLSKINSLTDSTKETMRIFGDEAGAFLMPLVEGAKNGTVHLQNVISLMPKITTTAANSGDAAADSLALIIDKFKSDWNNTIGDIVSWLDSKFPNGIRVATLKALAYWDYYFQTFKNWLSDHTSWITNTFKNIGVFGRVVGSFFTGKSSVPMKEISNVNKDSPASKLEKRLAEIEKLCKSMDKAVTSPTGDNKKYIAPFEPPVDIDTSVQDALDFFDNEDKDKDVKEQNKIVNDLIYGNTNEATKLAMLGPELRESQKQTKLLEDIKRNTANTNTTIQNSMIGNSLIIKELN